ncbi:MAG TPA: O-antigen ligase family protein [Burkholderiales bacterium]|nr:O-antigen ligase family protein [Burkholderiales bacterium]
MPQPLTPGELESHLLSLERIEKPYRVAGAFTALILIALPALILHVPSGGSVPYHLAALFGVYAMARWSSAQRPLTRDERLACVGFGAFAVTILISLGDTGASRQAVRELDVLLRPLWAIPIIYLFIRARPPEGLLWFGVSLGAILAGLNALYEVAGADEYVRATGATSAITYGNSALAMGFIAAIGYSYFRRLGKPYLAVPAAALLLGLLASALSGSRGGWVAVPALAVLLLWHCWRLRYRRLAVAGALALGAVVSLAVLLPQSGVMSRVDTAVSDVEMYVQGTAVLADSPVGQRLELWRAAWDMFLQRPLLGGGIGHTFRDFLREGIAAGNYDPAIAVHTMPHNVLLDVLALRGLVGLAGVLVLWLALGCVFFNAAREASARLRTLGMAGLALLVSYAFFGLTDSVMDYGPPLVFFCFYSAVIVHLIACARLEGAQACAVAPTESTLLFDGDTILTPRNAVVPGAQTTGARAGARKAQGAVR